MVRVASKLEAILYLKGQPLPMAKLVEYSRFSRDQVEEGLIELMADYAHRDSALEIVETPDGFCLQLREEYQDLIQTLVPVDLGLGALRSLAAIALKGPLTLTSLVDLRGSGAYQHVQELVELGFVKKRRKADSRSSWLQVTDKFYQYFQVDKLPSMQELGATSARADHAEQNPASDEDVDADES
ncbi:SMC-Scp complex subunit ScpB [Leptolyngbya sp. AN02str]|uniref:SMC-Scp complex subunit ScpB n=1 Tax=Leptolyngbya sp. AN02str TaxID=3423363 RepID=UPI003D322A78